MQIVDSNIEQYIEEHTSNPSELLDNVDRETHLKSMYPRMLSGKVQGRFLSMISKMITPKHILEIGTFTGYSAVCLAEGLSEGGKLHTIEVNEELAIQNEMLFNSANLGSVITTHYGNAVEILPQIDVKFDLIFVDADKVNYVNYFNLCIDKLEAGGFMLADNVLWSGKVVSTGNLSHEDKDTNAIKEFNNLVQQDNRVENVIIPLRDGITLIRKK